VETLILTVIAIGLGVAFCGPVSVEASTTSSPDRARAARSL